MSDFLKQLICRHIFTKLNQRILLPINLLLLLCSTPAISQSNILKEFSIQGLDCGITKTGDNGLAVVYGIQGSIYLIKMDSLLNVSWIKQLTLSAAFVDPVNIIKTSDDGFIISFIFPNGGAFRTLLVKTNAQGSILWSYYYERNSPVRPVGMVPTAINGAVIVNQDFSIFKIDSLGNVLTSVKCSGVPSLSASSFVELNGDYYVYGISKTSGIDVLVLTKLNSAFQIDWSMVYDGNFPELDATCIQSGLNNNLIIAGFIQEGYADTTLILSVDLNGNFLWGKLYNDLGTMIFNIHTDSSGYYVLGGLLTDSTYKYSKDVFIRILNDGSFMDAFCTGNSYASGNGLEYVDEIIPGYNNDYYALTTNSILKSTFETYPLCYYSNPVYTDSSISCLTSTASLSLAIEPLTPMMVTVTDVNSTLPAYACNNVGLEESITSGSLEVNYSSENHLLNVSCSNEIRNGSVRIFNVVGKEVKHYKLEDELTQTVSLTRLPAGIYFLLVQADANYKTLNIMKR